MSTPIRVLHVIGIMNIGGAETMIMNLYRHIDRTKVQFDFVENSYERGYFDDEIERLGGRIYRCPHYNGKNHFIYIKWWKDFFKKHEKENYIVHGHIGSTAALYLGVAKKYHLYTIAHSHNAATAITPKTFLYGVYSFPTRYIANHFFSCSKAAAISRFGKRIAANSKKCTILNNAIDSNIYCYDSIARKRIRGNNHWDKKYVIGHIGRFDPVKNHSFLVKVFKKYYLQDKSSVLVLIGDGVEKEKIKKLVQSENLNKNVIFMGYRKDIPELLQAIDILVLPSFSEGLPVTVIEGQAAGLTCLCSASVTREVDITGLCKFLNIDSSQKWIDELKKNKGNTRSNTRECIIKAGYDIKTTAKWIEDYYLKLNNSL